MHVTCQVHTRDQSVETSCLVDSGAAGIFVDHTYIKRHHVPTLPLKQLIKVNNVDGTPNKIGYISHYAPLDIRIHGRTFRHNFLITSLGKEDMILGYTWLKKANPDINWQHGTIQWRNPTLGKVIIQKRKITCTDVPENPVHIPKTNLPELPTTSSSPPNIQVTERLERTSCAPRNSSPEELLEDIKPDEVLLAYIQGEEFLKVYAPETTPLSEEYKEDTCRIAKPRIGRLTFARHGLKFVHSQSTWIQAKINPAMEFAQNQHKDKPEPEQPLPDYCQPFSDVFEKKRSERFPDPRPYDHAINLKDDFAPRDFKMYPLSPKEQGKLDEFLEDNLRKGYIRPSQSPMASPFFFVGKKDGSLRPCQDYRYLNEHTVKDAYPLPLISDLMNQLKGAKIFTKLDLRNGYNNVRIKDGDQWKAAFKTNKGLFEPMVMFFGLCNSPATFQHMMNDIFRDMINEGWIVIYMDDILIFSPDAITHRKRTLQVLERLKKHDLYLKREKCQFDVTRIEFLGLIVTPDHIEMDSVKVDGLLKWPEPKTVKEVRSFLGFGNFYRKFIAHYADLARPLHQLTKKDVPFRWSDACQKAFDALKQQFTTGPVLLMPDSAKPFVMETDASKYATGGVLKQRDSNGAWHPCAYISQSFNDAERNYQIYDRELFAIIRGLDAWRHYFLGAAHPVTVLSDHRNLTYYRTGQRLTPRQRRWHMELSMFDLRLVHVPGTTLIAADTLSRNPRFAVDTDEEDEPIVMLPDHLFLQVVDVDLQQQLIDASTKDSMITHTLKAKENGLPLPMKSALTDWRHQDGLLFYKDRCYVPDNAELRRSIVQRYHDLPVMGHPGRHKTMELVRKHYWWPGMYVFIKNYVGGCATCQQMKVNTHPTVPPLMPITSHATRPFQQISVDFITDLPESNGYTALMVVVDHGLSKGKVFCPCTKEVDAKLTAELFHKYVYRRFGLPDTIISDRGTQFVSHFFSELHRILGVKLKRSTAYHPQTDGETERVNQELEAFLRIYCGNHPETWSERLIDAEFALNQRTHEARKASPFYLMMGYEPKAIPEGFPASNAPQVQDRIKELQQARDEALASHELARQKMAERVRHNFKPFEKGQKVWLEATNLKIGYESRKLAPKREGPFVITEVLGPLTYRLKLPSQWKIHPVFHATLLTPYHENEAHGPNYLRPPPDLIEGEEEYEVEAILRHKKVRGSLMYFIKWKGYPTSDNTWEPAYNLDNAKDILEAYKRRHRIGSITSSQTSHHCSTRNSAFQSLLSYLRHASLQRIPNPRCRHRRSCQAS